jgi:hypothetical protein
MTETLAMPKLTWNVDVNDPQAIFNRVANHLHNASGRSMTSNFGGCAYRGAHARRCAVGALFEGDPSMEINEMDAIYLIEVMEVRPPDHCIELMKQLQMVHDIANHWNEFGFTAFSALANVASQFGLTYKVPK